MCGFEDADNDVMHSRRTFQKNRQLGTARDHRLKGVALGGGPGELGARETLGGEGGKGAKPHQHQVHGPRITSAGGGPMAAQKNSTRLRKGATGYRGNSVESVCGDWAAVLEFRRFGPTITNLGSQMVMPSKPWTRQLCPRHLLPGLQDCCYCWWCAGMLSC